MKDFLGKLEEVAKKALDHSIAQLFLVFAGILVIVSVWKFSSLILVKASFFTLFFGLIWHFMTSLRKDETWGRHVVGSNICKFVLYFALFLLLSIGWIVGVRDILHERAISLLDIKIWKFNYPDILVIFAAVWLSWVFLSYWWDRIKCCIGNDSKENGSWIKIIKKCCIFNCRKTYKFSYHCKNCGQSSDPNTPLEIKIGKPHWDQLCPNCCLYELKPQKDCKSETTVKAKIDINLTKD